MPDTKCPGIGTRISIRERGVSSDTALRLARYFGTSAGVWARMQARYELEVAQAELERKISKEVKVFRAEGRQTA